MSILGLDEATVTTDDLALGRIVEAISKGKFWKDTAIFVVEDDAQTTSTRTARLLW